MLSVRERLERDGYAVIEDFLIEPECNELKEAAVEITENAVGDEHQSVFSTAHAEYSHHKDEYFVSSGDKIGYFYEPNAVDATGNLLMDPNEALNKLGHALHLLHPIFRCYTYSNRVKNLCSDLGFQYPAVVQSMFIFKNPRIGGEVVAHQDSTFIYTAPVVPIGFWIALDDATTKNGCLWIAKGSHTSGVHRRLVRNKDVMSTEILVYDRPAPFYPQSIFTPVPVKKGTCIVLHGNVVHKSDANYSSAIRRAYTFHVVERQDNYYSEENWLQEGPNAPFVNVYTTPQTD